MLCFESLGQYFSETMVNFENELHKNGIKIKSYSIEAFQENTYLHTFLLKFDPLRISYSQIEKIVRDEWEDEDVDVQVNFENGCARVGILI